MKPLTYESGPAYLFCPASRPDRYQKALDAADFAILDLEDAVAPADKATARQALLDNRVDPEAVIVRVNAIGSEYFEADLEALRSTEYRRIMVPKAEAPEAIAAIEPFEVVALCETARGVVRANEIAQSPNVVALMWGAEDLMVSLRGRSSRHEDGSYRDAARHARSMVLMAAGSAGLGAIDAIVIDFSDDAILIWEAADAAASGFIGKACIHPRQSHLVRDAFRPTESQVAWASQIVAAAQSGGTHSVDGVMVDAPLLHQAAAVVAASRADGTIAADS